MDIAYVVMAYVGMAYIVMVYYRYGMYRYGMYSYGMYSRPERSLIKTHGTRKTPRNGIAGRHGGVVKKIVPSQFVVVSCRRQDVGVEILL